MKIELCSWCDKIATHMLGSGDDCCPEHYAFYFSEGKHRSLATEADRTHPETGYRPDCGFWYEMHAGQHRAGNKCRIIETDGVATMADFWCTEHEAVSNNGAFCVEAYA